MDIWSWVFETQKQLDENGHGRLSDLIGRLPSAVIEDENDEVEAIVPEALGLARSLELPWVEIFVRHWHLQALGGGYDVLPEAIDLLDFSHGEQGEGCPQSVCVVQDLARAYEGADGPGFAQERLDVADETLARIDPSWPCFACISSERSTALIDAGRAADVATFIAGQRAAAAAAGVDPPDHLEVNEARALLELGRLEEALERLDTGDHRARERDDTFARNRRIVRAQVLAGLGRHDEAREALLDVDLVLREPNYARRWAEAVAALVAADAFDNDWRLGSTLERMLATLRERGMAWDGVRVATVHGDLALRRGAAATARHALALLREQAERLRDPARAQDRIDALDERVAAAQSEQADLPATGELLLDQLDADETPDPEAYAERLAAAHDRWPDDAAIVRALANALEALGRPDDATGVLRDFAQAHPDDLDSQLTYGFALMEDGRTADLEELAARLEPHARLEAEWLRACSAERTGDARTAAKHAHAVLELDDEALGARRLLAAAAEQLDDFETALEQIELVIEGMPDDEDVSGDHWRRVLAATALERWDAVRSSSAELGIELEGESGPVEEEWALVRLRFDARDFGWAVRTGPVTARVESVDGPQAEAEHAGDVVLFDPRPVDEGDPEEGTPPMFPVLRTLRPGGMRSVALDGFHPGDEAYDRFAGALRDDGWIVERRSPDEYRMLDEDDEDLGMGLFVFAAMPQGVDDAAAHARLSELTREWPQPFTWLELAEAAGDEAAVREQRALADKYELY